MYINGTKYKFFVFDLHLGLVFLYRMKGSKFIC